MYMYIFFSLNTEEVIYALISVQTPTSIDCYGLGILE